MMQHALSTLSMWPTTNLVRVVLAHVICRLSMRQWIKSVNPQIGIASNSHLIFADIAYQVSLTTSYIDLWIRRLKFWSSRPIVGDRGTGLAGFNLLIDPT